MIGGTGGDIGSLPFVEAARQIRGDLGRGRVAFVHVPLVPYLPAAGEPKTKPTQCPVAAMRSVGTQPDAVVVPGGFGGRGVEGGAGALQRAGENRAPTPGPCPGVRCTVNEAARHLAGPEGAASTETDPGTADPVIATMDPQRRVVSGDGDLIRDHAPGRLPGGPGTRLCRRPGLRHDRGRRAPPLRGQRRLPPGAGVRWACTCREPRPTDALTELVEPDRAQSPYCVAPRGIRSSSRGTHGLLLVALVRAGLEHRADVCPRILRSPRKRRRPCDGEQAGGQSRPEPTGPDP